MRDAVFTLLCNAIRAPRTAWCLLVANAMFVFLVARELVLQTSDE